MSTMTPLTPIDPRVEMFQRGSTQETFFNMKALQNQRRPLSSATEIFETEFEDDDDSEIELDDELSPRLSFNSAGRRSETTLSSYEEIRTPSPGTEFRTFDFELVTTKPPVEGPRGPHLFRSSVSSSINSQEEKYVLGMSPITPKPAEIQLTAADAPKVPVIPKHHRPISTLSHAVGDLNMNEVSTWSPQQVARWMYDAGFDPTIVDRFEENDISGAILMTLKFEDLRELDIQSFGQRTKVWNEIHVLRGSAPSTPNPITPIDDTTTAARERSCGLDEHHQSRRPEGTTRRHRKPDIITPLESVSIVGIEQLMPKPHRCSKGENCSKWRKQQRLIEAFKKEHPVSPEGGSIWVAGDPGNPLTATSARPFSDAVPSVVASSDVLGPGTGTGSYPAFRQLEEASLRNVAERDPQDNVKQFIKFQHMDPSQMHWSTEEPPSPPYEMFPPLKSPLHGLRGLPKLAIPPPRASSANAFMPYQMERIPAMSPDLRNLTRSRSPPTVYRFGTPFSEMDVPVTHVPMGPISRDTSQSVPPNMTYRHAPAPIISPPKPPRSSRQASLSSGLPRINENAASLPKQQAWPPHNQWAPSSDISNRSADDISFQGWMKKRRTKMLRHEWHEHHFTLKGTRLAMHKDARALETLEYIDVDDYAIACSSLASGSKLNAAFKAMNISLGNKDKKDDAAFAFQLIPAVVEKGLRLRRESKDGKEKGKTHHFAVKSRDERIDWMRELMLAKALKQKSEGFEVNVNGNMI